jgi:hypothetical protein
LPFRTMPTAKRRSETFSNLSDHTDDSDNIENGEFDLRQGSRDLAKSCVVILFYKDATDIGEDLAPAFTASH